MFTMQDHSMEKMTAVWLLPIVAGEVAAVSGALLVPYLSPLEALSALILCYALWAFSVPVAMSILALLTQGFSGCWSGTRPLLNRIC
jgi:tellurite resistance protein TehA-like permease